VVLQDYYNSPTSLLSEIHWLPVNRELISKLLHLCTSQLLLVSPLISLRYKYLIGLSGPSAKLIRICYLCHAATAVLDKEVSYCAPKIWNDTPLSVRQSPSLDSFKRNLKTHYFAIKHRVTFKIATIMHQTFHHRCPSYLSDLVVFASADSSVRQLRSSTTRAAAVKRSRTQFGRRAFSVVVPDIWNSLPPPSVPSTPTQQSVVPSRNICSAAQHLTIISF